jgi:hypothetical protein
MHWKPLKGLDSLANNLQDGQDIQYEEMVSFFPNFIPSDFLVRFLSLGGGL